MERLRNQTTRGFSSDVTDQQQEVAFAMASQGSRPFEDVGLMLGNITDLAPHDLPESPEAIQTKDESKEDDAAGEAEQPKPAKRPWSSVGEESHLHLASAFFCINCSEDASVC